MNLRGHRRRRRREEARVVTDYPGCACLPFASSPDDGNRPRKKETRIGYVKVRLHASYLAMRSPGFVPRSYEIGEERTSPSHLFLSVRIIPRIIGNRNRKSREEEKG